jgi:hypothetical protein
VTVMVVERSYLDSCLHTKFHCPALSGSDIAKFQASTAVNMKSLHRAKIWFWYCFCFINLHGCHSDIVTG